MPPAPNNWSFVTAAYVTAWIAVIGYWVFVHGAVRRARARYEQALADAARVKGKSK